MSNGQPWRSLRCTAPLWPCPWRREQCGGSGRQKGTWRPDTAAAGCWEQRRGCWWPRQTGASASDSVSCRHHQARLPHPRGSEGEFPSEGRRPKGRNLWYGEFCGSAPVLKGPEGLLSTDASPACWPAPSPFPLQHPQSHSGS